MSTRSQSVAPPAVKPRWETRPLYLSSAGQDAVELAAGVGLHLDPWQQYVLEASLGERADGSWAASEVGLIVPRQNGKGALLEARELFGLFLGGEKLILHSAQLFPTAVEGFRRIEQRITDTPDFAKRVKSVSKSHGSEGIELKSGARLRFVARSRSSARGFSGDLIILDEAYDLSDEAMEALLPTLSARPNAQVWYTSSAPLADSAVLRRLCIRGRAGKDERLFYAEYCADDGADPRDRTAWAQANPALGIRLSEEFTERELAALSPEGFLRERLGIWSVDETESVIPVADWNACRDAASQIEGYPVFAIDMSPARTHCAIAAAGKRADGLSHVEVIDYGQGPAWVVARVIELATKWKPGAVIVDERSAAASLIPELLAANVPVQSPSSREVAAASGRFFDACQPDIKTLRHLGQPVLDSALRGALVRPMGDAWTWDRRKPTTDISPLVAVTLALWGWETYGGDSYDVMDSVF